MVLSISEESEGPAAVPEGSMSNNHAVGLSPYQICPNETLDAEPEVVRHNSQKSDLHKTKEIEGIIVLI